MSSNSIHHKASSSSSLWDMSASPLPSSLTTSSIAAAVAAPRRQDDPSSSSSSQLPSRRSTRQLSKWFDIKVAIHEKNMSCGIEAATIDELMDIMEETLKQRAGLKHLQILYLLCHETASPEEPQLGSGSSMRRVGSAMFDHRTGDAVERVNFILCRSSPHVREDVVRVLQRKGRIGTALLSDAVPPSDMKEVLTSWGKSDDPVWSTLMALPASFACVARTTPRNIQFRLVVLPSISVAERFLQVRRSATGEVYFRVPEEDEVHQIPSAATLRDVSREATSLSEFTKDVLSALGRRAGPAEQLAEYSLQRLMFYNPLTSNASISGSSAMLLKNRTPDEQRQFRDLLHIAQLSGLTNILAIMDGPDHIDASVVDMWSAPRNGGTVDSNLMANSSSNFDESMSWKASPQRPVAGGVLQHLASRRLKPATPTLGSTPQTPRQLREATPPVSIVQSSTPIMTSSIDATKTEDVSSAHPVDTFRASHLRLLGIDSSPTAARMTAPTLPKREEIDNAPTTALIDALSLGNHALMDQTRHAAAWQENLLYRDAIRESEAMFPIDVRTGRRRDPPPSTNSPLVTATATSTHRDSNEYPRANNNAPLSIAPERTMTSDPRRQLLQLAMQLCLAHPMQRNLGTSALVTILPDVVETFLQKYPVGLSLVFPLRPSDESLLRSTVDGVIQHTLTFRPELFSVPAPLQLIHSPQRRGYGGSNGDEISAATAVFEEIEDSDRALHVGQDAFVTDTPPMADRVWRRAEASTSRLKRNVILARPHFDAVSKRLVFHATIGVDIFSGRSAAWVPSAATSFHTQQSKAPMMPFQWFLRKGRPAYVGKASDEVPLETLLALGIARSFIISYQVPITLGLELRLDPDDDLAFLNENISGPDRLLIHRWRTGGVAPIVEEGETYLITLRVSIRNDDDDTTVTHVAFRPMESLESTQAFVVPKGSGIAPHAPDQLYRMLS